MSAPVPALNSLPSTLPATPPAGVIAMHGQPDCSRAGAILTIDTGAIAANYHVLRRQIAGGCGAVVKADAYGLGAAAIAPVLYAAGCRTFFTATLDEGISLRPYLPSEARIVILHGVTGGHEAECLTHGLTPVLNTPRQVKAWAAFAWFQGKRLPAFVQVDTGMSRLGLSEPEVDGLMADGRDFAAIGVMMVMSHLACADTPDDPYNDHQRAVFERLRAKLPVAPASLAASSGCFLAPCFHYDLGRPGAGLYGIAPVRGRRNPFQPVIRLDARVLQIRDVPGGTPAGYGRAAVTTGPTRLATLAIGYADGYLRSGGNRGQAWFGDIPLPVMGRVSMDSLIVDATAIPDGCLHEGMLVEIIGPHRDADVIAADLQTSGYEVLTGLGRRFDRQFMSSGEAV